MIKSQAKENQYKDPHRFLNALAFVIWAVAMALLCWSIGVGQ